MSEASIYKELPYARYKVVDCAEVDANGNLKLWRYRVRRLGPFGSGRRLVSYAPGEWESFTWYPGRACEIILANDEKSLGTVG